MKIMYNVTLKTPAMTGKDGIIGKDLDLNTKLDKNGLPYFSGSHIKGILKEKIEAFSKSLGINFPISKYFGEEGNVELGMRFSALTLNEKEYFENSEFLLDDRSGIRIERESRTTKDNSLFSYGYIKKGIVFQGEIDIFEEISKEDLEFLKGCLERVDLIGGLKSRGLGKVEIKIDKIESLNKKDVNFKLGEFKEYYYTLKALEDLILKNSEIGNEITTNNYVHGGSLRGAIITLLSKEKNIDLDLIIRNLKVSQGLPKDHFIALSSIFESKYPIKNGEKVRVNKLLSKNSKDEFDGVETKFERFGSPIVNKNFEKLVINKQNEINISIDRETKTSEEGKLYNKEILLAKDIEFCGRIFLTKELAETLSNQIIYIGKNKSKGFGKCLLTLKEKSENKEKVSIEKLEKLSKEISTDKKYFTIDFVSDMILPFTETDSIGEKIKDLIGLSSLTWEKDKSFVGIISIAGYNQLNRIRKASELAISKGSVLTYSIDSFSEEIITKLNTLQEKGIGSRKNEGFGEIEISSKQHLEVK